MTTLAVERSYLGPGLAGAHPKMYLLAEGGGVVVVPWAPREVSLDGVAPTWTTAERGGRTPLVLRTGDGLRTMSFDLLFGHPDPQVSVEEELQKMRAFARTGARVKVVLDHTTASNLWRLTGFTQQVMARQHGTNQPTRAVLSTTWQQAVDPVVHVGPLTGGAQPAPPAAPTAAAAAPPARRHTVVRGDTLSAISLRYYGKASLYPRIADANKIRNPNLIYPGQVFVIP